MGLLSVLITACTVADEATPLNVQVASDGSYAISVHGRVWFNSGPTFVNYQGQQYTTTNQSLTLGSLENSGGTDKLGEYKETKLTWNLKGQTLKFESNIQVYASKAAIVFEQVFPDGIAETGYNKDNFQNLLTSFPSVLMREPLPSSSNINGQPPAEKGYVTFDGRFLEGSKAAMFSSTQPDGPLPDYDGSAAGGPCVIFDKTMETNVVFSAFDQFMAASMGKELIQVNNTNTLALETGIMGGVTSVPAGFSYKSIMKLGTDRSLPGTTGAVKEWGDLMMGYYGKKSVYDDKATRDKDISLNKLGFSTDNGAFYYGHTEPRKNYQETIMDIKAYADQEQIPYQYILLDSWWYWEGPGGGVKNWTARPSVFPDGMKALYEKTGWKVQGHNRYWCNETDYAKQNGGDYDFILQSQDNRDSVGAIPNSEVFWEDLLQNSTEWGLGVYEQDWLYNEFDSMDATRENITLARDWLMQMGAGAEKAGVTIQYCMSLPRFILQTLEIQAVSQFRAGDDYHPGQSTECSFPYCVYYIGTSSIMAWSLGLGPAKDDFWSTNAIQGAPNNTRYNNDTEPYNVMEAAISAFSTGPVQPSDAIGYSNATLIGMTCTSKTGTLLQPSKPATAIDACFGKEVYGDDFDGPVANRRYNFPVMSTHTEVATTGTASSSSKHASLITIGLNKTWSVYPKHMRLDLDLTSGAATSHVAWTGYGPTTNVTISGTFDGNNGIALKACEYFDFQMWHVAPVLHKDWVFLGEPSKFIPVSVHRVQGVTVTTTGLTVDIQGDSGEVVDLAFAKGPTAKTTTGFTSDDVVAVRCTLDASGKATAKVPGGTCA
jgi:hypothetical protein